MNRLSFSPCSEAALCVRNLQGFGSPEICGFFRVNLLWCSQRPHKYRREIVAGSVGVTTKFKIQF